MFVKITESEILKMNPHIAPDQLEKRMAMLAKLRLSGLRRSQYRIAMPYGGRRASVQEDDDSRVVRLRHSSERA